MTGGIIAAPNAVVAELAAATVNQEVMDTVLNKLS
jgi:hypothetical protein